MAKPEFIALIGQDVVVDYPFFKAAATDNAELAEVGARAR